MGKNVGYCKTCRTYRLYLYLFRTVTHLTRLRVRRFSICCRSSSVGLRNCPEQQNQPNGGFFMYTKRQTLEERFWAKVNKESGIIMPHMDTECWVWTAGKDVNGYGNFHGKYIREGAHRTSYKLSHGDIENGMVICHRCDNPPCVRPDHLFSGTVQDNVRDAINKGRMKWALSKFKRILSRRQVSEIRSAYMRGRGRGVTQKHLAIKYGVSHSTIRRTISNKVHR